MTDRIFNYRGRALSLPAPTLASRQAKLPSTNCVLRLFLHSLSQLDAQGTKKLFCLFSEVVLILSIRSAMLLRVLPVHSLHRATGIRVLPFSGLYDDASDIPNFDVFDLTPSSCEFALVDTWR